MPSQVRSQPPSTAGSTRRMSHSSSRTTAREPGGKGSMQPGCLCCWTNQTHGEHSKAPMHQMNSLQQVPASSKRLCCNRVFAPSLATKLVSSETDGANVHPYRGSSPTHHLGVLVSIPFCHSALKRRKASLPKSCVREWPTAKARKAAAREPTEKQPPPATPRKHWAQKDKRPPLAWEPCLTGGGRSPQQTCIAPAVVLAALSLAQKFMVSAGFIWSDTH